MQRHITCLEGEVAFPYWLNKGYILIKLPYNRLGQDICDRMKYFYFVINRICWFKKDTIYEQLKLKIKLVQMNWNIWIRPFSNFA
ncbi:hypothetical protein RCL_jg14975.t1 [Rhizophagus clarus]|uniref:Uncharacterized protein n=1 Tax=Rhizophagus clarus TaxID=94130 RepID=A0A8H3M2G6_9GLOM|nr:hypothetical protein RCL_jg14975.t1 [Rhizophagus clarus]